MTSRNALATVATILLGFLAVQQAAAADKIRLAVLGKGGPVGDKAGPDSAPCEVQGAQCNKGDLIRLVIDPNEWWGTDLTRIDSFRIKRVK